MAGDVRRSETKRDVKATRKDGSEKVRIKETVKTVEKQNSRSLKTKDE